MWGQKTLQKICARENQRDMLFIKSMRNVLIKGAPTSLNGSVVAFLCRSGVMLGEAIVELSYIANHEDVTTKKPGGGTKISESRRQQTR